MKPRPSTVVITGGASGLGRATARCVTDIGAHTVLVDLPNQGGADVANDLGPSARFVAADVRSEDEVRQALEVASEGPGGIRGLVHCAGRGGDRLRVLDRSLRANPLESFADVVGVNLTGTYNVLRLTAEFMADNSPVDGERGVCVLTSSIAAFDGLRGQTSYASSKGGVHSMVLAVARDLASLGIRVAAIAPGVFDTPMLGTRFSEQQREEMASQVPFPRRLGIPEEFGALAVHILTNPYLNGETIRLDGALRMGSR